MDNVHQLRPGAQPPGPFTSRVRLRKLARLDVEQARAFLMGLDDATQDAGDGRAMYLLGVLAGHAQSLLDALDAVTVPGDET
jgi:hypothetical protein